MAQKNVTQAVLELAMLLRINNLKFLIVSEYLFTLYEDVLL